MRSHQVILWYGGFIAVATVALCAHLTEVPIPVDNHRITDDRLLGYWTEAPVLIFELDEGGYLTRSRIKELEFKEKSFAVAWNPICTYQDYWGTASTEKDTGFITLAIEGGNFIPKDFYGRGRYRFDSNGDLLITGISFGTKMNATPHATYVFHRR